MHSSGGHKGGGVKRQWLQGSARHEEKRKLKGRGGGEAACSVERSPVFRIRIRIRIRIQRIHVFWSPLDPDPQVRGMAPDPDPALNLDPDPSVIMQK